PRHPSLARLGALPLSTVVEAPALAAGHMCGGLAAVSKLSERAQSAVEDCLKPPARQRRRSVVPSRHPRRGQLPIVRRTLPGAMRALHRTPLGSPVPPGERGRGAAGNPSLVAHAACAGPALVIKRVPARLPHSP